MKRMATSRLTSKRGEVSQSRAISTAGSTPTAPVAKSKAVLGSPSKLTATAKRANISAKSTNQTKGTATIDSRYRHQAFLPSLARSKYASPIGPASFAHGVCQAPLSGPPPGIYPSASRPDYGKPGFASHPRGCLAPNGDLFKDSSMAPSLHYLLLAALPLPVPLGMYYIHYPQPTQGGNGPPRCLPI